MLLLKNATFIDWKTLDFTRTNILVEDGIEGTISFTESSDIKGATVLDCAGKIVTKSFAVGHHHVYSALATGMGAPKKIPKNFREILQYIWWTLDKSLDKEMIEASALVTAVSCAKAGSTFVIDHHASPNCINGSLEIIADSFEKVGVSHLLCYEITDRDSIEKAEEGRDETENYLKEKQGLVGLHASFTVGNDSLKKASDLMKKHDSGIHIHVAEDLYDQEHCLKNYGKRVIERLNEFEILNSSKTILGHCLHLTDNERNLIKDSDAWIVQNIESNLNNNVGFFNSSGLGNNIMLGTDGMHSNMIRSAQSAFFVGQAFDSIDYFETYQRFRNVHHYLSKNNFKGDFDNNLVVLDYPAYTPVNSENFLGHFIFGFSGDHVLHVISDGNLILKNRIIQTVNESEITAFAQEQALNLWNKMKK